MTVQNNHNSTVRERDYDLKYFKVVMSPFKCYFNF